MGNGIVRTWPAATALAALLALTVAAEPAEAQSGQVTVDRFAGAWELVDWRSTDGSGNVSFPYGENAQGQISYTATGRMSAHLMRPPEDPSDAPPQHLAYWGRFSLQASAGTVTHHVIGSSSANWIGSDQVRGFSFEGPDTLVLSAGSSRLTWQRVR
jgi:hypothetical protein